MKMKAVQCCALLALLLAAAGVDASGSGETCPTHAYVTDCRGCLNLDAQLGTSEADFLRHCCANMMDCYTTLMLHGISPHSMQHFMASQRPGGRSDAGVHVNHWHDESGGESSSGDEETDPPRTPPTLLPRRTLRPSPGPSTLRPSPRPTTRKAVNTFRILIRRSTDTPQLIPVTLERTPLSRLSTLKPTLPSRLSTTKPKLQPLTLKPVKVDSGEDKVIKVKSQEDKEIKIKEDNEDKEDKENKEDKEMKVGSQEDKEVKIKEDKEDKVKIEEEKENKEKQVKIKEGKIKEDKEDKVTIEVDKGNKDNQVKIKEENNRVEKLGSEEKKEEKEEEKLLKNLMKSLLAKRSDGESLLRFMSPEDEPVAMA